MTKAKKPASKTKPVQKPASKGAIVFLDSKIEDLRMGKTVIIRGGKWSGHAGEVRKIDLETGIATVKVKGEFIDLAAHNAKVVSNG